MTITAYFTNSGIPVTGLSPSIVITLADTGATVITDVMIETGNGWYKYDYAETLNIGYNFVCNGGPSLTFFERIKTGSFFTPTDLLNETYEGTDTIESLFRFMRAFLVGIVTGAGTTVLTFKGADGVTNRIQMTVDGNGNRSLVLLNPN